MSKTISHKQIEANRRNARKSTGPKTQAGKAASKLNALKHGILSREVVVRGLKIRESSREFDSLRRQFWEQYAPLGPVEEMLVDRIVTAYWRQRRALTAESGEITLNVDRGHWKRNRPDRLANQLVIASLSPLEDVALKMEESAPGLNYIRHILGKVRDMVERDGELTDAALRETHYIDKPNSLTIRLKKLRESEIQEAENLDEAGLKARKQQILAAIDRMLQSYAWQEQDAREREQTEESARQAAAVLPSADTLDKILRYETTLERQMYRAMHQLERLQRMRHGEAVPPPLSMEVSAR
jgi:hypothetical protein